MIMSSVKLQNFWLGVAAIGAMVVCLLCIVVQGNRPVALLQMGGAGAGALTLLLLIMIVMQERRKPRP